VTGPLTEEQFQALSWWIAEAIGYARSDEISPNEQWLIAAEQAARLSLVGETKKEGE
jgi:hypothetical protein